MRTVFIMRHGKSRWDEEGIPDIGRKLSARGKHDAHALGEILALSESAPDRTVASPARRATGTAKRVARAWGYDGQIVVDERLYEGTREGCLTLLRQLNQAVGSVLLVGHNPHLEEMALLLGGRALSMGTCTVARIDVPIDRWSELRLPADGTIRQVWEPQQESA
jgi:phosphohistidine phosphatase